MKTLNYVVAFVLSFGFVACSDDSGSPASPSAVPAPSAAAPGAFSRPATSGTVQPASVDTLRPGGGNTDFNAYDFTARHADGMLNLALMEDEMSMMRTASQPHRNRMITVGVCANEPHHAGEWCGDPIWQGSMMLSGTVNLDPIPLDSCPGWIVVQAAELSDDRYDGYRNAPCPTGAGMTRSDGTGSGWSSYPACDENGQPEGLCVPAEPVIVAENVSTTPAPMPAPVPAPTTPEPTTPEPMPEPTPVPPAVEIDDRAALVDLYNATSGRSWTNDYMWLTNRPLDEWYGVTTDSNGRVIAINLRGNNLNGPIPATLGNLSNLKRSRTQR